MIRKIIAGPRIIAEVIGGNGPEQLQQQNPTCSHSLAPHHDGADGPAVHRRVDDVRAGFEDEQRQQRRDGEGGDGVEGSVQRRAVPARADQRHRNVQDRRDLGHDHCLL